MSALVWPLPHCFVFFFFSFCGFSGEGPRLAVVTRADSCYCVDEFEILQL